MGKFKFKVTKEDLTNTFKKKWYFYILELVFLGGIITADLCSKDALEKLLNFTPGNSVTFIKGFMDITYSQNTGAGFGSFSNNTVALSVISTLVVIVMFIFLIFAFKESEWLRFPLIMVAAGGIGNLVDRFTLGYVRDFFEFTFVDFAIFNVADSFVTIGAIWLIIVLIVMLVREGSKNKKEFEQSKAANGGATDASLAPDETTVDKASEEGIIKFLPNETASEGSSAVSKDEKPDANAGGDVSSSCKLDAADCNASTEFKIELTEDNTNTGAEQEK